MQVAGTAGDTCPERSLSSLEHKLEVAVKQQPQDYVPGGKDVRYMSLSICVARLARVYVKLLQAIRLHRRCSWVPRPNAQTQCTLAPTDKDGQTSSCCQLVPTHVLTELVHTRIYSREVT
jgi:hypothetical protein